MPTDSAVATLDIAAIAAALGVLGRRFDVDVMAQCASTNGELLQRAQDGAASGTVVVAERQTAGRGRMGRNWCAEPGASLTFSLLWRFPAGTQPHGLSLAVGVAVIEALTDFGIDALALKWPNDVLSNGRKLAGVLVEMLPGTTHVVVIGIGINLKLPATLPDDVRATAAAVDAPLSPNDLLARLLTRLHEVLTEFGGDGFSALRQRWLAHCGHIDTSVTILSEFAPALTGQCIGVDVDGALLVETPVCIQRIISGDVSLRTP